MTAVLRIVVQEVERVYRLRGIAGGAIDPRFGAVTLIHRFGGSLNLNVHFHIVALDGVYAHDGRAFHPADPPDAVTLRTLLARIHRRVTRWAVRHAARFRTETPPDANGLESVGAQRGLFATLDERGRLLPSDDDGFDARRSCGLSDRFEGFTVHAGVTVAAGDRDGRERLCRYGARPPFSLERLSVLDDGRIAYRTKYPGPHGHTHRVMTAVEFLARIAALIPPPRYPLVRYHGVLAPNARLRKSVVPSTAKHAPPASTACAAKARARGSASTVAVSEVSAVPRFPASAPGIESRVLAPASSPGGERSSDATSRPDDRRLMHRIDWAELLRRVHRVDALACPRCHGRLRFIAVVTERAAIRRVLDHLGESPTGPPPVRVLDAWAG